LSSRRPASRLATPVPATTGNGSNGQRSSVVLGPNDRLVGQLYIEGDLRVSGTVDGALEATGDIEIAGSGKVSGTVTAYNRLVVGSDASLIGGDVRVARLTVEDGATFTGRVSMGKHEATVPAEPEPVPAEPASATTVAETVPESGTEPRSDEFDTPRASVGWTKRKKGR
jgi:cytoskeletal protein CcmA (bactofilin family)